MADQLGVRPLLQLLHFICTDYRHKSPRCRFQTHHRHQYEAGAKYQPHSWHGFLSGSFYNVTENNVQTGAVRSRGGELEGVADLFSSFRLHAGYDYDDMVVTKANDDTLGHRPILVPEQTSSLLLNYTVPRSTLRGMEVAGGVRYIGITAGAPDGTLAVPGYTLYDGNVGYEFRGLRFAVNATNVADKRYVAACDTIAIPRPALPYRIHHVVAARRREIQARSPKLTVSM